MVAPLLAMQIGSVAAQSTRYCTLSVPGLQRPVLYPDGVGKPLTRDDTGTLVPFGGQFPSNRLHDKFAWDPSSERLVGVSAFAGVFVLNKGEPLFTIIAAAGDKKPVRHPRAVLFNNRTGKFLISDPVGLLELDTTNRLAPLSLKGPSAIGDPGQLFDAAGVGGMVVTDLEGLVYVLLDDGRIHAIGGPLQRHDFVWSVKTTGGSAEIVVKTHRSGFTATVPAVLPSELPPGHSRMVHWSTNSCRIERL